MQNSVVENISQFSSFVPCPVAIYCVANFVAVQLKSGAEPFSKSALATLIASVERAIETEIESSFHNRDEVHAYIVKAIGRFTQIRHATALCLDEITKARTIVYCDELKEKYKVGMLRVLA